jgi:pyrroline-5-carboxylate reductase
LTNATIAIIGAGHMGTSLLGGLIANKYPADKIWMTDTDTQKLANLKDEFPIHTATHNLDVIPLADVVILAVKPQILASVTQELANTVQQKKPLVISIAAGIKEASIQHYLGGDTAIVRAMPNTPALIRCGATALFANKKVTQEQRNLTETILSAVGLALWVEDEKLMDVVTALSGSGPAYFFLMIEALENAAVKLGMPKDIAKLLTLQTAYGASRMALESDVDAAELRKRVTSPGGTTEAAISSLEKNAIRDTFEKALLAAKIRSEELSVY